jgi:hypothetical protein
MSRHAALAVTVLLLCCATATRAQETITRTYELGDMMRVTRHYPLDPSMVPATRIGGDPSQDGRSMFGGGGGGGGEGQAEVQPTATPEAMTSIIMETIEPESWRDKGGSMGSLRFLGSRLIVTHTPDAHKALSNLLQELSAGGAYMVAVRAQWVTFTPAELNEIYAKAGGQEGEKKGSRAVVEVHAAALRDDNIYSQGQTLGYNGQTVHVASGRGNTVVTGMDPVVGQNAVGYQLQTAVIQSGVALQVTPQVLDEGQTVALDVRSVVSEVEGSVDSRAVPQTQPVSEREAMLFVDRPSVIAQQFSTTVRVPAGKKILIGGMTLDPAAKAKGAKQLYLVLEATTSK